MTAKTTRKTVGRPTIPAGRRASKLVAFRVTPAELRTIDKARGTKGRSAWIRMAIRLALA